MPTPSAPLAPSAGDNGLPCIWEPDGGFACGEVVGHASSIDAGGEQQLLYDVIVPTAWGTVRAERMTVLADRLSLQAGTIERAPFDSLELAFETDGPLTCRVDGSPCRRAEPARSGFSEVAVVSRVGGVGGRTEALLSLSSSALVLAAEGGQAGAGGSIIVHSSGDSRPLRLDALWDGDRLAWLASGQTTLGGTSGPWLRLDLDRGAAGGRSQFAGDGLDAGRQTSSLTVGAGDEQVTIALTARDQAGDDVTPSRRSVELDTALRAAGGVASAGLRTSGEFSVDGERRPAVGVATEATGELTLANHSVAWIPGARLSITNWSTAGETADAPSVAQQLDVAVDMELAARHGGFSMRGWGQLTGAPIIRDDRRELQFVGPWRVDEGVFASAYELSYTLRKPWGVARWQANARWSDRVDGAVATEFRAYGRALSAGARSIWRDDNANPARIAAWAGAQTSALGVRLSAIGESGTRELRPPSFGRLPLRRVDDASGTGLGVAQEVWVRIHDVRVEGRVIVRSVNADDVTGWAGLAWQRPNRLWGMRADVGRQPSGLAAALSLSLGQTPTFGAFAGRWLAPGA